MSQPTYPSSRHDRPHARIYDHWLKHPSWINLSGQAHKIISMLKASFRPDQPNAFPVGERRIAEMSGCAPRTAKLAIDELIASGFLRVERAGRNRGAAVGRERVVSLTCKDTETAAGDPDLPLKLWRQTMKSTRLKSAA
ncbi:hypothetical protein D1224_06850 [Henriciella barbarensis]|uniref:Uncharacterized protein n=1 Tax=Henriciella barbarensis TaxID=86342 RepID=A0A399QZH5_9PROT|nr:hypothetical protein D1224_06850 [Henriciella barbarensis]